MLAWKRGGYIGDAFGPAHHRECLKGVHPGKQARAAVIGRDDDQAKQAHIEGIYERGSDALTDEELEAWFRIEAARVIDRQKSKKSESMASRPPTILNPSPTIGAQDRERLVMCLGMLGSDHAGDYEKVPSRVVLELCDAISGILRVPGQAARSIG